MENRQLPALIGCIFSLSGLHVIGFNPCYCGFAFQTLLRSLICFFFIFVSILVIVDLPFRHIGISQVQDLRIVSILVIVDLPFRRRGKSTFGAQVACFNPCYCGFAFQTRPARQFWMEGCCFNPCYCGFAFQT